MSPARRSQTTVGRPREFDIDEALDRAMEAFWARGYEGTSMSDLMEAMGLQKGSIYKAFGDKHSLFLRAIQRYLDQAFAASRGMLAAADSPKEGIRTWLEKLETMCDPGSGMGCFAINAVVELAPHDEDVRKILDGHFTRYRRLLRDVIARGQELGEFRDDRPAQDLASLLQVAVSGLMAMARGKLSRGRVSGLVDLIESTLTA